MTSKVLKGSVWTLVGQVVPLMVSLFTTPFVIRFLGAEGYGVYILVGLIPAYLNFADVGMGIASTKFGSDAYASGDSEKEAQTVRTAALIAFLASLPFALCLFAFSPWIVSLVDMPDHLRAPAALGLKFTAATLVITFLNGILNTPQLARLRMDLYMFVSSGFRIVGSIAAPVVLFLGGGIAGAFGVLFAIGLLTLGAHLYVSGRLLPALFGISINRSLVGSFLRFGGPLAAVAVATALLINLEKLVLTLVTSVQILAYYSVAFNLTGMATMLPIAMLQSLFPAFSQLLAPERRSQLNELFSSAMRINLIGMAPIIMVLFVIAKPLITIWAGEDFGRVSSLPFYVLLFGMFFNLLAHIPYAQLLAAGRTVVLAKLSWFELLPYIALIAVLTSGFGAVGAAAAWSLRVFFDAIIIFWLAKRLESVSFDFLGHAGRFVMSILILSPPVLFALLVDNSSLWLIVLMPCCLGLYSLFVWKRFLRNEEKMWIRNMIPSIGN